MPEANPNALALAGVQPDVDIIKPLKSLAELNLATAQAGLASTQARFQQGRLNALQAYAKAKQAGDPNALDLVTAWDPEMAKNIQTVDWTGKSQKAQTEAGDLERAGDVKGSRDAIAGFADLREKFATTWERMSEGDKKIFERHTAVAGQTANAFITAHEQWQQGKITKQQMTDVWNAQLSIALANKTVSADEYKMMYDNPSIDYAKRAQQFSMAAKDAIEQTGVPAGNRSQAELPAKIETERETGRQHRATERQKPLTAPSGTTDYSSADKLGLPQSPLDIRTPPQIMGNKNPDWSQQVQPPVQQTEAERARDVAQVEAAEVATRKVPKQPGMVGSDLPDLVVPKFVRPQTDSRFTFEGKSPETVEAIKQSTKEYDEKVQKPANSAMHHRATLNTVDSLLVANKTGKLTPQKQTIAGYIYAVMGQDANAIARAKQLTGIDLSDMELLNKETTQMGLSYARDQEGAREAVAAIRIALGAQPSLDNSTEGNRKVVAVMRAGDQWIIDKQAAGEVWRQEHSGDMRGFDTWFNRERPVEQYISRSLPYHLPSRDDPDRASKLLPGVVYQYQNTRANRVERGQWNGTDLVPWRP